jgi:undecaprenyl-diphosphatase
MINWWEGMVLGLIQGATEFLPVSSSGHLALAQALFKDFSQPGLLFDVSLHLATALAVVVYFYKDILGLFARNTGQEAADIMLKSGELTRIRWKLVWMIVIAMVPTGIIGFALKDLVETSFSKPLFVGIFLIITALILFLADLVARKRAALLQAQDPGIWQAIIIGVSQGIAVFPGISRSGATISTGICTGVRGDYAARFSFLLSVPAVLAASALSLVKERSAITAFQSQEIFVYLLSMACAFVVGYFSIKLVFNLVKRARLSWFGLYCLVVGTATVLILSMS